MTSGSRTLRRWLRSLPLLAAGCAGVAEDGPEPAPGGGGEAGAAERNRYNVLFIAVDDLRPELGCYGAEYVQTPHIDALAAEGVTFLNHFAAVPTCGASRYALLTGRSPLKSGVRRRNSAFYSGDSALQPRPESVATPATTTTAAQTLPELFRNSGYSTTLIGKVSHTPDGRLYGYDGAGDGSPELPGAWDEYATPYGPWQRGWGSFFAYADGAHREDGGGRRERTEFPPVADDELPDGMMAAAAVRRLEDYAVSGEPFFLAVGFYKPHLPWVAPREDWEAVQDWPVPLPEVMVPSASRFRTNSGEFLSYRGPGERADPGSPRIGMPVADVRRSRLAYLACVRYVDRQIGRVLTALEEQGLAENTIVVLWSDHGWYLGEGAMWGKHTPLERALRCPLIVRAPGMARAGLRSEALAASIDVYPTLLELCRPRRPATAHPLDGISQVPVLDGSAQSVRESVSSYWGNVVSFRTADVRLLTDEQVRRRSELYGAGEGPHELFDRLAPPPIIY